MDKNFYEILGVSEDASIEDIKKAFKKLSLKWHPDRWVTGTDEEKKIAEEKFKEISEAYSTLSDEQKKEEYDLQRQGGSTFYGNPFTGFGFGFGGPRPRPIHTQGNSVRAQIEISLKDAYFGCNKTIFVTKEKKCSACNGTGSKDGKSTQCPHCHGTGMYTRVERRGNMTVTNSTTCPYCHGTGKVVSTPCSKCGGSGLETYSTRETVDIPKGVKSGVDITFPGKGSESPDGGPNGDLIVSIKVSKEDKYELIGNNIVLNEKVPFCDALLGCEREVEFLDGKKYKIKLPELTEDRKSYIFNGQGMPIIDQYGRVRGNGDLAIVVRYDYPKKLDKKTRKIIEELKNTLEK